MCYEDPACWEKLLRNVVEQDLLEVLLGRLGSMFGDLLKRRIGRSKDLVRYQHVSGLIIENIGSNEGNVPKILDNSCPFIVPVARYCEEGLENRIGSDSYRVRSIVEPYS